MLFAWDKQLSMVKIQGIGQDTDQLVLLSICLTTVQDRSPIQIRECETYRDIAQKIPQE